MTEIVSNKTSNYTPYFSKEELSRTYGGEIYLSDFEIGYFQSPSYIANRIIRDKRFDEQCKKNQQITKQQQNYTKERTSTHGR